MNKFKSTLCAALALTFAAGSAIPVTAAPIMAPKAEAAANGVINVQTRLERRENRRERRFDRRQDRREARFERRNGVAYYGGHRGYRYKRSGYREYNGYWFPLAAFAAGAVITGAIANSNNGGGSAHVQWCYDRYRSYRASDNTFQPYNGPRQYCNSPYN